MRRNARLPQFAGELLAQSAASSVYSTRARCAAGSRSRVAAFSYRVLITLNRIIFDGHGGAKTAERWEVGHRIRDVEQGPDGSLWLLEDGNPGALIHVTPK
jgi:glucose/arabinose dehydrogenase